MFFLFLVLVCPLFSVCFLQNAAFKKALILGQVKLARQPARMASIESSPPKRSGDRSVGFVKEEPRGLRE